MRIEELWEYQEKIDRYKGYMQTKFELDGKFNPKYLFSAEQAAYVTLNRLQKEMVKSESLEPCVVELQVIQEAETIIDIDKGLLNNDEKNYAMPLYFFWNLILNRLEGESFYEFFRAIIVLSTTYNISRISKQFIEDMFDESINIWDREWATECICDSYFFLNSDCPQTNNVRDKMRELLWTEEYARRIFSYIK